MKEIFVLMVALLLATMFCGSILADPDPAPESPGPAPNSGDGIPDGPGFDPPFQNGYPDVESPGPAPNSGDEIPDGSGF